MIKRISVLDDLTINKIAAGEVVERPSSVVKELMENALDANSSRITIEINEGGKDFIKIIDNGNWAFAFLNIGKIRFNVAKVSAFLQLDTYVIIALHDVITAFFIITKLFKSSPCFFIFFTVKKFNGFVILTFLI